MRRPTIQCLSSKPWIQYSTSCAPPPIIRISNGTFYRHHPDSHLGANSANPALFEKLNFELPSFASPPQYWSIIGPSSAGKTTFLQILRGKYICVPATVRSFPYLESNEIERKDHNLRVPSRAIGYVGFDGEQGLATQESRSAYLSARYESRREATDFSVFDYLQGHTELNPSQDIDDKITDDEALKQVIKDLRLDDLIDMPVSNLSNGQTRRARIARALLSKPEVLLLDEPFMGLDPPTLLSLSPILQEVAAASAPRLVLTLRPQDPIPDWITHLIFLKGNCKVAFKGPKKDVLDRLRYEFRETKQSAGNPNLKKSLPSFHELGRELTKHGILENTTEYSPGDTKGPATCDGMVGRSELAALESVSRDGYPMRDAERTEIGEPLVEMRGARVSYGSKSVLGNGKQEVEGVEKDGLWWTVRRGQRWGIFGPNGSGKTTILSLICSDHPQTYSLPIKLFGRSRRSEPGQLGISIFDIQARIGHSSPEIQAHIPRSLTLRQVLENAWSDTFRGMPKLNETAILRIDAALRWFESDLRPGSVLPSKRQHLAPEVPTERELGATAAKSVPLILAETDVKPVWAEKVLFGELPFSAQRVALFLRATIKHPDMVILDEAFSGMDDGVRDRCLLFLAHGEEKEFNYDGIEQKTSLQERGMGNRWIVESDISKANGVVIRGLSNDQALICISHVKEEIPGSIREWICLPEASTGASARFGRLDGPIEGDYKRWSEIWGV